MSTPVLVLATHNQGKVRELRDMLRGAVPGLDVDTQVVSAAEVSAPDVRETGVTFEENSLLKARAVAAATGLVAVADDSGLAVDVLGGAPGIFSARWSGRHGDDAANRDLLLAQLSDVEADEHRGAAFVCAAALVVPAAGETTAPGEAAEELVKFGRMEGTLALEARGEGGFGYDPLLIPAGETRTCAEMAPEEKNAISHRGQAMRALLPELQRVLSGRL